MVNLQTDDFCERFDQSGSRDLQYYGIHTV